MINCLECAKLKRENERLKAEVIRQGQRWLELKKFIISQEKAGADSEHGKDQRPDLVDKSLFCY